MLFFAVMDDETYLSRGQFLPPRFFSVEVIIALSIHKREIFSSQFVNFTRLVE